MHGDLCKIAEQAANLSAMRTVVGKAQVRLAHLPHEEGLLVNDCRLHNFAPWKHAPSDCIHAGAGLIAVVVTLAGDCHVGKRRLLADGRLKRLKLLRRHKELDVRLLIDIPAQEAA